MKDWPDRVDGWIVAFVALAMGLPGVFNDFVYDDVPLIRDNVRVHGLSRLVDAITNPYWPPPFVEQLYRPLTVALLNVEYTLGHGSPFGFRLVSCVLYAVVSVLVFRLARRVVPRMAALALGVLFAVHPVHVEAVALAVNQSELLIGILACAVVVFYVDIRRARFPTWRDWVVVCVACAVASLIKETGFVLPLFVLAAELTLIPNPLPGRPRSPWTGYVALTATEFAVLAVRSWALRGHPIAAVAAQGLRGLDLSERLLMMLQVAPTWFRLFTWPVRLSADYALAGFTSPKFGAVEAAGLVLVCSTFAIMFVARKRLPALSFGLAWCVIGLLPVSNLVPTGVLVAERTLFLPSIGILIAAGVVADRRARRQTRRVRSGIAVLCLVVAGLGAVRSVGRLRAWNSVHMRIVKPVSVGFYGGDW